MQKLMNLRNNRKKGFTLIELIIVIVIIAILVAALTPAILSVIERANISADEADARTMIMIGSVAGTSLKPPQTPEDTDVEAEIAFGTGGTSNIIAGKYTLYFEGPVAIGCMLEGARSNKSNTTGGVSVGNSNTNTVVITVP